jgi:hypothetical protein
MAATHPPHPSPASPAPIDRDHLDHHHLEREQPGGSDRVGSGRWQRRIAIVLTVMLAASLTIAASAWLWAVSTGRIGVEGWRERASPVEPTTVPLMALQARFARADGRVDASDYELLTSYFFEGWAAYRTPKAERAHYPGLPSGSGRRSDGLEGYARMFPLAAAWLASGRAPQIETATGPLDLAEVFTRGLVTGTDPASPDYWGPITDFSQTLVESADIALGLWLARKEVWAKLSPAEQQQVVSWLMQALGSQPYDGNWQLFPMLVHRALNALGADVSRFDARMQTNWEIFRSLYRGQGWFSDPPHGLDDYNAWSVHYALFWLQRIDPGFESAFISQAQGEFARFYVKLFGPQGHPQRGRSSCYRMATPAPLLASLATAPGAITRGQAMRALDLTWSWFIGHGALAAGSVTAGLCGADPALQANYSGPASCLWSLRPLVMVYVLDRELGLLESPREPLAVERGDFVIRHETTGWTISGRAATGAIDLSIEANPPGDGPEDGPVLKPYGLSTQLAEALVQAPRRPDNTDALYRRRHYTTDKPVGRCTL